MMNVDSRKKIITRVKRLVAMARDSSDSESDSANRLARQLMAKHNLTDEDLGLSSLWALSTGQSVQNGGFFEPEVTNPRVLGEKHDLAVKRVTDYTDSSLVWWRGHFDDLLAQDVARLFGIKCYFGRQRRALNFAGDTNKLARAIYFYNELLVKVSKSAKTYLAGLDMSSYANTDRVVMLNLMEHDYITGYLLGMRDVLEHDYHKHAKPDLDLYSLMFKSGYLNGYNS